VQTIVQQLSLIKIYSKEERLFFVLLEQLLPAWHTIGGNLSFKVQVTIAAKKGF
jgi:hypothetical protein